MSQQRKDQGWFAVKTKVSPISAFKLVNSLEQRTPDEITDRSWVSGKT